ncbi:MAG: ATP-dependent helicase [Sinobacteraceae bacterium]|nr:ATP-dependent helicase [Nevskiaceae bacterium]
MSPTTEHLEALNGPQRRAVTYGEPVLPKGFRSGPLLIVAGAGTGKTSTLAARVAHLVIHGVEPGRILMLTFTRRAALEMRHRARDIVKKALNETVSGISQSMLPRMQWAGTFHAIGARLLRHYARQLKLDPNFTILDRGDAADLIDSIREELGFARLDKRFPRKDVCLAIYSHRVNTQSSLQATLEQQFPWCVGWAQELTQIFRTYVERKQQLALLDYDDLLLYWHAMMQEPRFAQHVSRHFDHVLVDEYQDTNRLQAEILLAMRPDGAGLTVVGDDAQAIYSFRAAAVDNILGFPDHFTPRAEVVTLAQNYRSTQPVLDVANALMAEAPRQYRKHLLSIRGDGPLPSLVTVDDLSTQAEFVCSQILKKREMNLPLRRQAVLFRTASHSDLLEIELTRRKIPFVKYGGLRFLEAAHVKDLLAILRWADNLRNDLAGFRVLQLMPGMGPVNARAALQCFAGQGRSVAGLREFKPPADARLSWNKLLDLLTELTRPQRAWAGQVGLVREWYKPLFERLYEHFHTRVGDLDQLELLSGQHATRERFLAELTLDPPQATSDVAGQPLLEEDYLVLSTVHSAKGMEWDSVCVLNVVDGSFPNEYSTRSEALLEEERRLLYVAMTRARQELALVQPLRFAVTARAPKSDAHVYGGRSRFMTDKVLKTLQETVFYGTRLTDAGLADATADVVDVTARAKQMW